MTSLPDLISRIEQINAACRELHAAAYDVMWTANWTPDREVDNATEIWDRLEKALEQAAATLKAVAEKEGA